MTTYSEKLKHPKWQKKRLQILNRDKFTCKLCRDTETTLHVHHKYYETGNDPWDYPNTALVTLCEHCHKEIEDDKEPHQDFENYRIYKSDDWKGGSRVMFLSNIETGITRMRIFDEDGNFIIGYNLTPETQKQIMKVFKFSLK